MVLIHRFRTLQLFANFEYSCNRLRLILSFYMSFMFFFYELLPRQVVLLLTVLKQVV